MLAFFPIPSEMVFFREKIDAALEGAEARLAFVHPPTVLRLPIFEMMLRLPWDLLEPSLKAD
jgi:hypothetical protein